MALFDALDPALIKEITYIEGDGPDILPGGGIWKD